MPDIVKRLNRGEGCREEGGKTCIDMSAEGGCICAIAADTITRLRAEVERLGRDYETAREAHDRRVRELDIHCTEVAVLRAEVERLRAAIQSALRQLADGNRVLATDTLARVLT